MSASHGKTTCDLYLDIYLDLYLEIFVAVDCRATRNKNKLSLYKPCDAVLTYLPVVVLLHLS